MSNKFTVRGDPILFVLGGNRPDGRFLLIDSVVLLLVYRVWRRWKPAGPRRRSSWLDSDNWFGEIIPSYSAFDPFGF